MPASQVRFNEIDASLVAIARGSTQAIVGPSSKGALQEEIVLKSENELLTKIGGDIAGYDAVAIARQMLKAGAVVKFSRSVHMTDLSDFATRESLPSSVSINDVGTNPIGAVQITAATTLFFNDGDQIIFDLDGVTTAKTFSGVAATHSSGIAGTYDFSTLAVLTVKMNRGSVQEVSIAPADIVAVGGTAAVATAAEVAQVMNDGRLAGATVSDNTTNVIITSDIKGSASYIEVTGGAANAILGFVTTEQVSAGPNTVPNLGDVSAEDLYDLLVATPVVDLTPSFDSGTLTITNDNTGAAVYLGFDTDSGEAAKFGWTTGAGGRTLGGDGAAGLPTLKVEALEEGTWADGVAVTIVVNPNDVTLVDISISTTHPGIPAEFFGSVNIAGLSSLASSNWKFTDLGSINVAPTNLPAAGAYVLSAGDNGTTNMVPATHLGSQLANTGLYPLLTSIDYLDAFVPGLVDNTEQRVFETAGRTKGFTAHLSMPSTITTIQAAIDFRRQEGVWSAGTMIDSSYAVYHLGQLEFRDTLANDGSVRFYGNEGGMGGVLGQNDTVRSSPSHIPGPWLIPSGPRRGKTNAFKVTPNIANLDQSDLDLLHDNQINWFQLQDGVVIAKGNRTATYNQGTLLKFYNVRRMLLELRIRTRPIYAGTIDEPNDPELWRDTFDKLHPVLQDFQDSRALFDFRIDTDQDARTLDEATLNTPAVVAAGNFRSQLRVQPVPGVEIVDVEIRVDELGVSYEEVG